MGSEYQPFDLNRFKSSGHYQGNAGNGSQSRRGVMILVFGILGILCCVIFGIVAWVMGRGDLKLMDSGEKDDSERALTKAGMILGMIGCGLTVLILVVRFAMMMSAP